MANILIFSDIHIHTHKSSLKRLQHCLDTLRWVFDTAIQRGVKNVLFLGDLFQDREKIQILPYQRTYEIINHYCGDGDLNLYLLVGNHDMWFADKTDISSVYPFGSISGVKIINKCQTIDIDGFKVDFLPFTLNPIKVLEDFQGPRSRLLCGHISLDGAQLNTLYGTQADVTVEYEGDMIPVDAEQFTGWEKVLLGHYHGEQRIKNIEYVGSPLQLNFAEAFQKKHIILLDTDTLEQEYISNDFSPRHLILKEDELSNYDLNNAFVKMTPKDMLTSDLSDLKKQLFESCDILTLEFTAPKLSQDTIVKEQIVDAQQFMVQDKEEMLDNFIKASTIPDALDLNTLLSIGKDICQRSQVE